jgi:hypothetical protein
MTVASKSSSGHCAMAGMEVIYVGLRRSPTEVGAMAVGDPRPAALVTWAVGYRSPECCPVGSAAVEPNSPSS